MIPVSYTHLQEARKLTTILLCEVYVALLDFGDDIPDTQLSPYLKKLENAADPSECSRIFFSCIQGLLNAKTKTSMEAHTYICQAISYIQQHYSCLLYTSVPFSGECAVIAVLRQNVRIGGLSFQIGNRLPFLLIALEIRIFLSLGGKFLAV